MIATPPAFRLRCAPIAHVRIGLIGLGQRGLQTLRRYAHVEGASICAIASLQAADIEAAQEALRETGRTPARAFVGENAWRDITADPELDLIYICTDWQSHAAMAIEAMNQGRHVAVEVPAATTVEDCWALVRTAERTLRHCFMTENCCYDWFTLATLALKEQGFFGTITHCEGAYIHDWRSLFASSHDHARTWYRESCRHGGNPYPTHGIGPIAQLLGFHRGDRMRHLVSMTGQAAGRESLLGHANHTLITTERGVTILLQFDGTTPRPYSRIQGVCGTEGFVQKYPLAVVQTENELHEGEAAEAFMQQHLQSEAGRYWLEGRAKGVPNEMN